MIGIQEQLELSDYMNAIALFFIFISSTISWTYPLSNPSFTAMRNFIKESIEHLHLWSLKARKTYFDHIWKEVVR